MKTVPIDIAIYIPNIPYFQCRGRKYTREPKTFLHEDAWEMPLELHKFFTRCYTEHRKRQMEMIAKGQCLPDKDVMTHDDRKVMTAWTKNIQQRRKAEVTQAIDAAKAASQDRNLEPRIRKYWEMVYKVCQRKKKYLY